MEEVGEVPPDTIVFNIGGRCLVYSPWYRVRIEVFLGVVLAKQLHAKDSKDIDDDEEDESEIPESTKRGNDDTEKNFHSCP